MIRIDFSSKQVRAALSVVFSTKTYNHLVSTIARKALALMTSVKNAAWSSFVYRKHQVNESVEESKLKAEVDRCETLKSLDPQSKIPKVEFYQKTLDYLQKATQESKNVANLTIEGFQVVHDIVNYKSPHNIGLETLQQTHRLIHIKGDGNCCFNSMAFGMLHELLAIGLDSREKAAAELIHAAKQRVDELHQSQSEIIQGQAKSSNTIKALETIDQVIANFAKSNQKKVDFNLINWIDDSKNLPFIGALRYLAALVGCDVHTKEGLELLESQLKQGSLGIQSAGIADYLEKISHFDPTKKRLFYGGNIEVQGFAHLFNLQVDTFSLTGIGDRRNQDLTPFEAVEKGRMRFSSPNPLTSFRPLLIVHSRFHYDAALMKDETRS